MTIRAEESGATLVFLHGRGQGPEAAERFAARLDLPGLAVVAPGAADESWYPQRYFDPRSANEPHLARAHEQVGRTFDDLAARGVPPERIVLGGFSQGACIALDVLVTSPRPLAALVSLCGCLIGSEDVRVPAPGSLGGLDALVTGAAEDSWVSPEDVRGAADALRAAGAQVDVMILEPGAHRIRDEEVAAARALLEDVISRTERRPATESAPSQRRPRGAPRFE